MNYLIFIFLLGCGLILYVIGCYTRRISLLSASLVFNLANVLTPWVVVFPSGFIQTVNTTTNTTYVVYTYDYLDFTTQVVLSMLFVAFTIFTILQLWNVITYQVRRGVEEGEEVFRV